MCSNRTLCGGDCFQTSELASLVGGDFYRLGYFQQKNAQESRLEVSPCAALLSEVFDPYTETRERRGQRSSSSCSLVNKAFLALAGPLTSPSHSEHNISTDTVLPMGHLMFFHHSLFTDLAFCPSPGGKMASIYV